MKKRMIIMVVALTVVFGGIFAWNGLRAFFMRQYFAHYEPPPATVSTTVALLRDWQPYLDTVGTITAINGVDVTTEVAGIVQKIHFESGQMVNKDEALLQLDDSTNQQDLNDSKAQLRLMALNFQRFSDLYKKRVVSAADFDKARAQLQQAEAAVARNKVLVAQKFIKAPFAGKIGIRAVNVGQYISPGTKIVTLQSLDPVYVQFSLPEQEVKSLYVGQAVIVHVDAYPQACNGTITAINSKVDENTRNILVQATLPNDNLRLYPGMFANVNIALPTQEKVVTLPQTAVSYDLYGNSVFIIKDGGKDKAGKPVLRVLRKFVKVGERHGNEVAILDGVAAGDQVVTSGQLKLQDGTAVVVNNKVSISEIVSS